MFGCARALQAIRSTYYTQHMHSFQYLLCSHFVSVAFFVSAVFQSDQYSKLQANSYLCFLSSSVQCIDLISFTPCPVSRIWYFCYLCSSFQRSLQFIQLFGFFCCTTFLFAILIAHRCSRSCQQCFNAVVLDIF